MGSSVIHGYRMEVNIEACVSPVGYDSFLAHFGVGLAPALVNLEKALVKSRIADDVVSIKRHGISVYGDIFNFVHVTIVAQDYIVVKKRPGVFLRRE